MRSHALLRGTNLNFWKRVVKGTVGIFKFCKKHEMHCIDYQTNRKYDKKSFRSDPPTSLSFFHHEIKKRTLFLGPLLKKQKKNTEQGVHDKTSIEKII